MSEPNSTKFCRGCSNHLSLSDFGNNRTRPDGLQGHCKNCHRNRYRRTREKVLRQAKVRYQRERTTILAKCAAYNVSHKEKIREYDKRRREQLRGLIRKQKAAYYQRPEVKTRQVEKNRVARLTDPERSNEYSRKWRRDNPEARRVSSKNNKVKRINAPGTCTPDQWLAKCEYFGWSCYLCRKPLDSKTLHMDHRKPLAREGSHWPANLAPSCATCNLRKSDRTEAEFRALCSTPMSRQPTV